MYKRHISHQEHLKKRFQKNPREAIEYLNAALEDEDRRVFLLALGDVAKAFGGMTKLSRKTKIAREHLYTTLSESGNPEFFKLNSVLDALNLKIKIITKTASSAKTRKKKVA